VDDWLTDAERAAIEPLPPGPGAASLLARAARAVIFTAALGALLLALDRLALGPTPPRGWVSAASVDAVPTEAGGLLVPAYLPNTLAWPPARVVYRIGPGRGSWIEVHAHDRPEAWLFIGSGWGPPPPDLGVPARGEAGWRHLEDRVAGRPVHVITRLPPDLAERVRIGLKPTEAGR
jgi:hypothetical protein